MTLEQFVALQLELWSAFGWFARWWMIIFLAGSIISTILLFFLIIFREAMDQVF